MHPVRRSSSRIQRWVHDQQKHRSTGSAEGCSEDSHDTEMPVSSGSDTYTHAYLAYPHLTAPKSPTSGHREDASIEDSYIFVKEDEEMPATVAAAPADAVTQVSVTRHVTFSLPDDTDALCDVACSVSTRRSSTSAPRQLLLANPASSPPV